LIQTCGHGYADLFHYHHSIYPQLDLSLDIVLLISLMPC